MSRNEDISIKRSVEELTNLVKRKWPEALETVENGSHLVFSTGIESIDRILPGNGVPYGQLVEITGDVSSGKTSFLFRILAALTGSRRVVYIDFSNSFFPSAAESSGIDLSNVLLLRSNNLREGLRTAEIILQNKIACCIVFDLVRKSGALPISLMHRLRQKILKAGAIMIFLTEGKRDMIPTSMISLRFEVSRTNARKFIVAITRSRISSEGVKAELSL